MFWKAFSSILTPFLFFVSCLHLVPINGERLPNIVILFGDDLGYGDLQSYGHPTSFTPNLDRLAAGGLQFTQFYSAAAVCSPSRAALLTGRYQVRSGIYPGVFNVTSSGGLPHNETTFAEMLKPLGYYTAMVGKWHLGLGKDAMFLPPSQGFDEFLGLPASQCQCPCSICYYPDIKCHSGCNGHFSPCPLYNGTTIIEQPVDLLTLDQKYSTQARNVIRRNAQSVRPFLLYFAFQHTHHPQYAGKDTSGTTVRGPYGDSLSEMDWDIGQVLEELENNQLLENTFIFFTADNGPSLYYKQWGGNAGLLKCGKATTYEGGVRMPAIAHWPGHIKPGRTMALSSTLDILPTIAAITGASLPNVTLDGYDMSPFLFNGKPSLRDTLYYYPPQASQDTKSYAVRYKQYKAHFYTRGGILSGPTNIDPDCRPTAELTRHDPPLLFDLTSDPSENYNLTGDPVYQDVIQEIIKMRDGFEEKMVWGVSEINKPCHKEYMPCCNPGCTPFPHCCHCTPRNSIVYDTRRVYTSLWNERVQPDQGLMSFNEDVELYQ